MNMPCNPLMRQIYETGFAMDEANLYLDTHPYDKEALNYYHQVANLYNQALSAYETQFGPLRVDSVTSMNNWTWIDGKWPWEGGNV